LGQPGTTYRAGFILPYGALNQEGPKNIAKSAGAFEILLKSKLLDKNSG